MAKKEQLGLVSIENLKPKIIDPQTAYVLLQQTSMSLTYLLGDENPVLDKAAYPVAHIRAKNSEGIYTNFTAKSFDIIGINDLIKEVYSFFNSADKRIYIKDKNLDRYLFEMYKLRDLIKQIIKIANQNNSRLSAKHKLIAIKLDNILTTLRKVEEMLFMMVKKYFENEEEAENYFKKNRKSIEQNLQKNYQNRPQSFWGKLKNIFYKTSSTEDLVNQLINSINENTLENYFSTFLQEELLINMLTLNQFDLLHFFEEEMPGIMNENTRGYINEFYEKSNKDKDKYSSQLVKEVLIPIGNFVSKNFIHSGLVSTIGGSVDSKKAVCAGKVNIMLTLMEYFNIPYKITSPERNIDSVEINHVTISVILPNGDEFYMDTNMPILNLKKEHYQNKAQKASSEQNRNFYQCMVENYDEFEIYRNMKAYFLCYIIKNKPDKKFSTPVRYIHNNYEETKYTHIKNPQQNLCIDPKGGVLNSITYCNVGAILACLNNSELTEQINIFYQKSMEISAYNITNLVNIIRVNINSNDKNKLKIAEFLLTNALRVYSKNIFLLVELGRLLIKKDKHIQTLELIKKINAGEFGQQTSEAKLGCALLYAELGKIDDAIFHAFHANKLSQSDERIIRTLMYLFLQKNDYAGYKEWFEKLEKVDPDLLFPPISQVERDKYEEVKRKLLPTPPLSTS